MDALDELFGTPPQKFTAKRDELVRAGAKNLKAFKRPTVSVWAVNRVYRDEKKDFAALLAAGKKMRAAQAKGRDAIDEARKAQNDLIATLADAAKQAAKHAGESFTDAVRQRVETTLRALSTLGSFAPDAEGMLSSDREPVGFEAAFGAPIPKARPKDEPPPPKPKPPPGPTKKELAAAAAAEKRAAAAEAKKAAAEEKARAQIDAKITALQKKRDAIDAQIEALNAERK